MTAQARIDRVPASTGIVRLTLQQNEDELTGDISARSSRRPCASRTAKPTRKAASSAPSRSRSPSSPQSCRQPLSRDVSA